MPNYFEKARELGELLLASEESLRLADARADDAENEESAAALSVAEKDFSALVNQVLAVVSSTATGEIVEQTGCGKSCAGCAKNIK
ncbi:MAG: hypothetical protein LBU77_00660 [Clostridiales bacterium]|nr:hypothetical protein [Clostridiales bacterium]